MPDKRILTYEEFTNEEINLKKALAGAALGAGLMFGNPQDTKAAEPVKTELSQTQNQNYDYSKVFHVDSLLKKTDIKTKITSQINNLSGVRILTNTPDKITCSVTLNAKPNNSNGVCYATMDITFKDGRYKVDFYNIYFVYTGVQPQTGVQQAGQNLKRQAAGVATSVATSQIRNPLLQNVARQAANTITMGSQNTNTQKSNLTYQDALDKERSFVNSVDSEIGKITSSLESAFKSNTSQQNDW